MGGPTVANHVVEKTVHAFALPDSSFFHSCAPANWWMVQSKNALARLDIEILKSMTSEHFVVPNLTGDVAILHSRS